MTGERQHLSLGSADIPVGDDYWVGRTFLSATLEEKRNYNTA